ncbi:MAG: type II toxin-antitoxin system RelE/ParE family toxin [Chloroflexi bacterium]|nr:type II toxin-antitoxin system RelE/ParE family toxin [Chloroflexota bacterium]
MAKAQAAHAIDLLEREGATLDFPYTSQLHGKLRELRFHIDGRPMRISCYIARGRHPAAHRLNCRTASNGSGRLDGRLDRGTSGRDRSPRTAYNRLRDASVAQG